MRHKNLISVAVAAAALVGTVAVAGEGPKDLGFSVTGKVVQGDGVGKNGEAFVRIPRQSGRGFRFDAGHRSDLIPATIPK